MVKEAALAFRETPATLGDRHDGVGDGALRPSRLIATKRSLHGGAGAASEVEMQGGSTQLERVRYGVPTLISYVGDCATFFSGVQYVTE